MDLTLTRVRITVTDSNTAFIGVASTMSLEMVRDFMSAVSIAAISERFSTSGGVSPSAAGSEVIIVQCGGRRGFGEEDGRSWIIGFTRGLRTSLGDPPQTFIDDMHAVNWRRTELKSYLLGLVL